MSKIDEENAVALAAMIVITVVGGLSSTVSPRCGNLRRYQWCLTAGSERSGGGDSQPAGFSQNAGCGQRGAQCPVLDDDFGIVATEGNADGDTVCQGRRVCG